MSAPTQNSKITAGPASFTEIALVKEQSCADVLPNAIIATCADLNWCCKPASRCTSSGFRDCSVYLFRPIRLPPGVAC